MNHTNNITSEQRSARAIIWIGIMVALLMMVSGMFSLEYRLPSKRSLHTAGHM